MRRSNEEDESTRGFVTPFPHCLGWFLLSCFSFMIPHRLMSFLFWEKAYG